MRVAGIEVRTLALYGAIGVAAYVFLPKLLESIGKRAGDAAAGAAKGLAEGAGKTGGALLLAAPRAIDSALEELGADPQALERMGGAIGRGIYAAVNAFSPDPGGADIDYVVNFADGSRHAIPGNLVDNKGRFKYSGVMYQIKDDASGAHYATRL